MKKEQSKKMYSIYKTDRRANPFSILHSLQEKWVNYLIETQDNIDRQPRKRPDFEKCPYDKLWQISDWHYAHVWMCPVMFYSYGKTSLSFLPGFVVASLGLNDTATTPGAVCDLNGWNIGDPVDISSDMQLGHYCKGTDIVGTGDCYNAEFYKDPIHFFGNNKTLRGPWHVLCNLNNYHAIKLWDKVGNSCSISWRHTDTYQNCMIEAVKQALENAFEYYYNKKLFLPCR